MGRHSWRGTAGAMEIYDMEGAAISIVSMIFSMEMDGEKMEIYPVVNGGSDERSYGYSYSLVN